MQKKAFFKLKNLKNTEGDRSNLSCVADGGEVVGGRGELPPVDGDDVVVVQLDVQVNRSIGQVNWSIKLSIGCSIGQVSWSIGQVNQSIGQVSWSIGQVNQSIKQSIGRSIDQANRSISWSIGQANRSGQLINQLINWSG